MDNKRPWTSRWQTSSRWSNRLIFLISISIVRTAARLTGRGRYNQSVNKY